MTPYLQQRALLFQPLPRKPSSQLGTVIVIPACREDQLLLCLMALQRCQLPDGDVDIIVVVYDAETDPPEFRSRNLAIAADAERWAARVNNTRRWFHIAYHCGMPRRDAGPDLARKIGMDEACRRLEQAGNPKGIIACLNTASRCTPNFLVELERHFQLHPQCPACSICFEYPLNGAEYPPEIYIAALYRELNLRYLVQAQRYAGYPYAFHTQGPGMALRCDAYQHAGGMNVTSATGDASFLNHFTGSPFFMQLNTTCIQVCPTDHGRHNAGKLSPANKRRQYKTHAFQSFADLRPLFNNAHLLFEKDFEELSLPAVLQDFGKEVNARSIISDLRRGATDPAGFLRNFFAWFNPLMINQYARFARDHYYPDTTLETACKDLLTAQGLAAPTETAAMLRHFRHRDGALHSNH